MKLVSFSTLIVGLSVASAANAAAPTIHDFEGRFALVTETRGTCSKQLQIAATSSDALDLEDDESSQRIEHINKGDVVDSRGRGRSQLTKNMVVMYGETYTDKATKQLDLAGKLGLVLTDDGGLRLVSVEWESNGRPQYEPDQTWRHNTSLTIPKQFDNGIPETGVMLDCLYKRLN